MTLYQHLAPKLRFTIAFATLSILLVGCSESQITLEDLEAAAVKLSQETEVGTANSVAGDAAETMGAGDILDIEKPNLKFGFIKLTDCAPLVIAKEKGYFDDEGLNVEIEAQSNWKVLLLSLIHISEPTRPY